MRPTEKDRVINPEADLGLHVDRAFPDAALLPAHKTIAGEIWQAFAEVAVTAVLSNSEMTANNNPVFLAQEASFIADRMLASFNKRFPLDGSDSRTRARGKPYG